LNSTKGNQLTQDLIDFPDDFEKIYVKLKLDPEYHRELMATEYLNDARWQYWSNREFFKNSTVAGTKFEKETCLVAFSKRGKSLALGASDDYLKLRAEVLRDYGVDLYEYDMFSQVQLGFPQTTYRGKVMDYFVADQIFVKFDSFDAVEDIIIIENKLKSTTNLTLNQEYAKTLTGFNVRNITEKESQYNTGKKLSTLLNSQLNFRGAKIKWYKAWDSNDGKIITDIQKF
jgi:hypothetical protein